MNASFGIDHPLVATRDIDGLRERMIAIGFNMTAIGKHPWGTKTSLAMFDGCLLEIMSIYDETLIDEVPAGNFRFGRHVSEHLQQREGVALTALHSTDSRADAKIAANAGFTIAGHLEFGRDVTLPDGTIDRTKTTLALMPDETFSRLSFFLCQQHRPDLIYVPEWLEHPNKVTGICGVSIVAYPEHHAALEARFSGLYGKAKESVGCMTFITANSALHIFDPTAFRRQVGPLPDAVAKDDVPCICGMDFSVSDLEKLKGCLVDSDVDFTDIHGGFSLSDPSVTANTVFRFFQP